MVIARRAVSLASGPIRFVGLLSRCPYERSVDVRRLPRLVVILARCPLCDAVSAIVLNSAVDAVQSVCVIPGYARTVTLGVFLGRPLPCGQGPFGLI